MTQVRAKLKVVLQADDTVVAEAEDPALWQEVLRAINRSSQGDTVPLTLQGQSEDRSGTPLHGRNHRLPTDDAIVRMAEQLGVEQSVVIGSLSPSSEAPYLHLDMHRWSDMKRQVPVRGPASVNHISLASTLLALWFRCAELGNATQAQAQAVLGTVGVRDKNPTRGLSSSDWLQTRPGGVVIINAAKFPEALRIGRSFCSGDWTLPAEARPGS
jgi:hypothetical protein